MENKQYPLRTYVMVLEGARRKPVRVPKAQAFATKMRCREWWEVLAHTADEARELCGAWPMQTTLPSGARIVEHRRNRR